MRHEIAHRARTTARRRTRRFRRWYRRTSTRRTVGLGVAALLVISGAVFAIQALHAGSDLRRAANQAAVLQEQVTSGNPGAKATLDDLLSTTASAEDNTDGILWSIGARVPFLGKNVEAVRTVSSILDRVAREALPPVVTVSNNLDLNAFSPRNGTIDLANVIAIAPAVAAADTSLTSARADLEKLSPTGLLLPLREPVATIKDKIFAAQSAAASADVAARLMPSMLGQGGTRRYLLLVQNNAAVRATGGITGSYAIITAKNGRLRMGQQGGNLDLGTFDDPVLSMTGDEKSVFTDQMVRDLRNINVTPDFPRTGEIARAMARQGLDTDIDGVLSVDPVAMSYILAGTGPVTVPIGETVPGDAASSTDVSLDQSSVVELLLNTVYLRIADLNAQDDFYESTARTIFDTVTSGSASSRPVIAGMVRAAAENRLMLWSSRPEEQAQIAATGLSGAFAKDDGRTPHVGFYLGDAARTKMEYYLDFTTTVTARRCLEGGRQELTLSANLMSNAPRGLPRGVSSIDPDVPLSQMNLLAWLYAPFGGRFTDIRLDGEPQLITTASLDGRAETSVPVRLEPGQRSALTATILTGPDQDGDAILSTTPGVRTLLNDVAIPSACS